MSFFQTVLTAALGFALSGAIASGFEAATGMPAGFRLLRASDVTAALAVPVVTLGAAYILLRNCLFGAKRPPAAVLIATVLSGLWSLVIGSAALSAFA
ncbi:hypothetical protein IHQ68_17285 [Chelatococcus sambhunathii]|uniref:TrbC/VIRB2 family n=1 Tax=Chelatococcus sambhunathii TaxID=363953 RepID=A0ABU1DKG2_9HYPH|nr:hypothetical protein [Chelatococcus sambhunathii]MDR4308375.1 hypothetical protein [Chelatococcus sambhunathii]